MCRRIIFVFAIMMFGRAFSALDQGTKKIVYDEFLKLKEYFDMSIILVTHNPYEAEILGDKRLII